LTYKMAIVLRP